MLASQLPGQLGGVTDVDKEHCDFIKPAEKINKASRNCFIVFGFRGLLISDFVR